MNCDICGKKLRSHNRTGVCRKHGGLSFDVLTGKCRRCGKVLPPKERGHHASTLCETRAPWNKGETAGTSAGIRKYVKKVRGQKRPGAAKKIKQAWKDPVRRARWVRGIAKGQRKRFESGEEREKSRRRTGQLIQEGRIEVFGGRQHGKGQPPTASEKRAIRLLKPMGFVLNCVVSTGVQHPSHYTIDLAHKRARVAIELDGSSHTLARREGTDARKDFFLRSNGWLVLRYREPCDFKRMLEEAAKHVLERQRASFTT